jgi:hypothetical protein
MDVERHAEARSAPRNGRTWGACRKPARPTSATSSATPGRQRAIDWRSWRGLCRWVNTLDRSALARISSRRPCRQAATREGARGFVSWLGTWITGRDRRNVATRHGATSITHSRPSISGTSRFSRSSCRHKGDETCCSGRSATDRGGPRPQRVDPAGLARPDRERHRFNVLDRFTSLGLTDAWTVSPDRCPPTTASARMCRTAGTCAPTRTVAAPKRWQDDYVFVNRRLRVASCRTVIDDGTWKRSDGAPVAVILKAT